MTGKPGDTREPDKKTAVHGVLETSILSAHMKFFKGHSQNIRHPETEESVLYDALIRYFANNACK